MIIHTHTSEVESKISHIKKSLHMGIFKFERKRKNEKDLSNGRDMGINFKLKE